MPVDAGGNDHHARRLSDQGRGGRIRAFWHQWGNLVTGVWLIIVSVAVLWIGVAFAHNQKTTADSARDSCRRALKFGPALADAYERYDILNPQQLAAYRATLPRSCP